MHLFWMCVAVVCRWWLFVRRAASQRYAPAQGLVEYGLILVLIAVVAVGAITVTGGKISVVYQQINCGLRDAQMGSAGC
jgi:pilus assembly protein Flp/PilA